jgi:hypothetical protein
MGQFVGPETERMGQILGPETDIIGERYYISKDWVAGGWVASGWFVGGIKLRLGKISKAFLTSKPGRFS